MLETMPMRDGYESLSEVLTDAFNQAARGKGRVRHGQGGEPFEKQPICEIARRLGPGYQLGQAVKKIYESKNLDNEAAEAELLGAINYLAAAVIVKREKRKDKEPAQNYVRFNTRSEINKMFNEVFGGKKEAQ